MNTNMRLWQPAVWGWLVGVSQFVANWRRLWLPGLNNQPKATELTVSRPVFILLVELEQEVRRLVVRFNRGFLQQFGLFQLIPGMCVKTVI